MELRHLRYFVAVAEEQNVTRAARRLHVSQPPLSRQIRGLEEELGVALFERSAKSVRLTEAGRIFLNEAQAVLVRAEEATQTIKAVAMGNSGEIRIGYAPSLAVELLPHALREFQKKSPGVQVTLHDFTTEEMLDGLREGSLHVALMIEPSKKALAGMVFEKLRHYPICVAVHPAHPMACRRSFSLRQVAKERMIGYTIRDYPEYHEWLERLFAPVGVIPRLSEMYDSATSLIAAVETGRGVALVPQSFECFAGGRLKLRPVKPAPPPFVVGVARCKEPLSRIVEDFIAASRLAPPRGSIKIEHAG